MWSSGSEGSFCLISTKTSQLYLTLSISGQHCSAALDKVLSSSRSVCSVSGCSLFGFTVLLYFQTFSHQIGIKAVDKMFVCL